LTGSQLSTAQTTVNSVFIPNATEWNEVLISPTPSSYKTDNIIFRFEFYTGGGNHFYLDDIQVFDLSTLSHWKGKSPEWRIVPNPSKNVLHVESDFSSFGLQVFSQTGISVLAFNELPGGFPIDISGLAPGVYFVRIRFADYAGFQKLIVTE
jgi:hypothetical protein